MPVPKALPPYVRLHCSSINLCQSKLSFFPSLSLVIKLCETLETNPKSRTNYFKFKPLAASTTAAQLRFHIRQRRIFHHAFGVISPQRMLRYHWRSLCACGLPQISQRQSRYITAKPCAALGVAFPACKHHYSGSGGKYEQEHCHVCAVACGYLARSACSARRSSNVLRG